MTATAVQPSSFRPFAAIVGFTLRTALPGKRWVGILVPCAAAVLFGALSRGLGSDHEGELANMAGLALFGLVMPVTCLVVGDAVLGAEIRSGAFSFTWLSPVPAWQIAVGRWLGGTAVAAACLSVAFAASAVVAGVPGAVAPIVVSTIFGAMAYVGIFIAIGCIARRAAVWSLAFVFLVERLLGEALAGIAQLCPSWLARSAYIELAAAPEDLLRGGIPHGGAALVRLVLVTAVALWLASSRLRRLRLSGSTD